ncbi:MAG: hypothetical protein ACRDIU_01990 [Actinomycetota bacterium]
MGFKSGALIGFAVGYVQGSKAGRDRYEQINRSWKKVKQTPTYQAVMEQVNQAVGAGVRKGKIVALDAMGRAGQKMKTKSNGSSYKTAPGIYE